MDYHCVCFLVVSAESHVFAGHILDERLTRAKEPMKPQQQQHKIRHYLNAHTNAMIAEVMETILSRNTATVDPE